MRGFVGSPQSVNALESTEPGNALFLVTVSVRVLVWVVAGSIAIWDGTVNAKSGMVMTVPEYTAARISSPGW